MDYEVKLLSITTYLLISGLLIKHAGKYIIITLPIAAINIAIPALFFFNDRPHSGVTIAILAFIISWLSTSKALAYTFNRGPLSQQQWTSIQFIFLYILPVVPRIQQHHKKKNNKKNGKKTTTNHPTKPPQNHHHLYLYLVPLLTALFKLSLVSSSVYIIIQHKPHLPSITIHFLYVLCVWAMLGVLLDGPAKAVMNAFGISLLPTMTEPWKSRTLAEFWAQRWNQAAANALRTTVYQPILSLSRGSSKNGSSSSNNSKIKRRNNNNNHNNSTSIKTTDNSMLRFIATCMTFFTSGAAHEAIHYMVMGTFTPHYKWLTFFAIQAPLLNIERYLYDCMSSVEKSSYHSKLVVRLTMSLVLVITGRILFLGAVEESGLADEFAVAMKTFFVDGLLLMMMKNGDGGGGGGIITYNEGER
jgi:hypothetical protein